MTNASIQAVWRLFAGLFLVLALRQFYVQVVAAPQIAARPYNPRLRLLEAYRGRILAADGSVLAQTVGGKRTYPMGPALAQTVGYLSSRYGAAGLEAAFDNALQPADTNGDPAAQLAQIGAAFAGRQAVSHGADVVTTLDPAIETALASELGDHARGAGVVLDARSGAVLAIASVPTFDPNDFDRIFPTLRDDPSSPLLNRAIDGLYPPGSTWKIFTASAALDSGTVAMDATFDDPGYFQIGDYVVHDNEGEATGTQDLTGAFALSSNVDFAQIALKVGADQWEAYARRWGIGDSFDFQLPAERDRMPGTNELYPGILAQLAFGQASLLVPPLRVALLGATIAGNGSEPRPFIVREVVGAGGTTTTAPATLAQPISAETAENVKKMMVAVVERGTGTPAALPNVTVAGKTGTATNPGVAHSWFVCFAPADAPRIVVAVIVENGGYGADVAAPIARSVMRVALGRVKS
ncbi:MAG: cell division protein FtsI [Candidatus Eremiobacteraeota bacterium]|nr:cell division protein FtsI [Candidatus Eremiobacteraeota bacterium]